jgi:negative regulator of flagellin synthesis FlgM
MNDAISNYGRMSQSNTALRSALDQTDKNNAITVQSQAEAATSTATSAPAATVVSSLNLSNVAQKALAQPSFDRTKVDAIKKAIQNGTYAIDPKRIASSFVSLEKLIAE